MKYLLIFLYVLMQHRQSNLIGFTSISSIRTWWPQLSLAKNLNIPGYSKTSYNFVSLGIWTCTSSFTSISNVYVHPLQSFGGAFMGSNDIEIRKAIKQKYSSQNIKLIIKLFGSSQFPARFGLDPYECAKKLALDVQLAGFDGIQVDYQDTYTFQISSASTWLINFTSSFHQMSPSSLIVHSIFSSYFSPQKYLSSYLLINSKVGNIINFYNVKYYGEGKIDTYEQMFTGQGNGTSVKEITNAGVQINKIVISITSKNTDIGYIDFSILTQWTTKAIIDLGWSTGFDMGEFSDDSYGNNLEILLKVLSNANNRTKNGTNYGSNNNESNNSNSENNTNSNNSSNQSNNSAYISSYIMPFPIFPTMLSRLFYWSGPLLLSSFGIPSYQPSNYYNYFIISSWSSKGPRDLALIWADAGHYFASIDNQTNQIQKTLKKMFNDVQKAIIVSVFDDQQLPATNGLDPLETAKMLTQFVIMNNLDGVLINWTDKKSLSTNIGVKWLSNFQLQLRLLLPSLIISYSCSIQYFNSSIYSSGFHLLSQSFFESISFFILQYDEFNSYQYLFAQSINSIINNGLNQRKIVVQQKKPLDINKFEQLGAWILMYKTLTGEGIGVALGDYLDDENGTIIHLLIQNAGIKQNDFRMIYSYQLQWKSNASYTNNLNNSNTNNTNNTSRTNNTNNNNSSNNNNSNTNNTNTNNQSSSNNINSNSSNGNSNNGSDSNNSVSPPNNIIAYPIYFVYVNGMNSWWGPSMLASLGVPKYSGSLPYNYVAMSFWLSSQTSDAVQVWQNASTYINFLGNDTPTIQKKIKKFYNDAGIKIMISAFGSTQFPTTAGLDPVQTANKLADFILNNNLDGVDIDYEDNIAMSAGTAQAWLINFQKILRSRLPSHIITHAPQAPYFKEQFYKNGAYITVDKQVGHLIDFYNVQFYNQGDTKYDTYQELFIASTGYFSGTSVKELMDRGIQGKKIVLGKPATIADASNSGYLDPVTLGQFVGKFRQQWNWQPSLMFWQLKSDPNGTICKTVLYKAGVNYQNGSYFNYMANDTNSLSNNQNTTSPLSNNTNSLNSLSNSTNSNSSSSDNTMSDTSNSSYLLPHILSQFYCGFGGQFCGQSSSDDIHPQSSIVILAFANTQPNGSIQIDQQNYPNAFVAAWKALGKKIIISVGGQNGNWDYVLSSQMNTRNFIWSLTNYLTIYNLDGVDLDIQSYSKTPQTLAKMIIQLKKQLQFRWVILSPECVTIYQGTTIPSSTTANQAFNYMVPVIQLADSSIDYYQVQAYNNWYAGYPPGSLQYLQEVYLNWRNLQGTVQWTGPIKGFNGVKGQKLLIGLLASPQAGVAGHYAPPSVVLQFKEWLIMNKYSLKGFMMWDSHWDTLNANLISNSCVKF